MLVNWRVHNGSNKETKPSTIANQLTAVALRSLREELLLNSGQVPGISVQREQIWSPAEPQEQANTAPVWGNSMVQAIIQTLAQLGLNLPLSSDTNTGVKPSDTKTAATGGTQSTNASSRDTSLPAADIDAVFENFIGQILQMASSAQQDGATSSASQSDMGSIVNEATTVHYSNPLAQALESLAQAVGARSSEPRNESANGGTGSTKLDSTISSLEQNFNTLFDSSSTENAASLQTFLEKFASNVAQESASQSSVTFVRTSA